MLDRRTLLKGIAAAGAALILPPTPAENAEAVRRYWALDRTMLNPAAGFPQVADSMMPWLPDASEWRLVLQGPEHLGRAAYRATFYNVHDFRNAWAEADLTDERWSGGDARLMATISAGNEVRRSWPDVKPEKVRTSTVEIARR